MHERSTYLRTLVIARPRSRLQYCTHAWPKILSAYLEESRETKTAKSQIKKNDKEKQKISVLIEITGWNFLKLMTSLKTDLINVYWDFKHLLQS